MADDNPPVPDATPSPTSDTPKPHAADDPAPPAGEQPPVPEGDFDPNAAAFDSVGADAAGSSGGNTPAIDEKALQELLDLAGMEAPTSESGAPDAPGDTTQQFELPNFQQVIADATASSIDLLRDVDLNVKIELGRSRMLVEEVLKLTEGSVVELDKLAGDPVDVFVNERLVARGEVLVLNDNFCVRVNEIVSNAGEEQ